MPFNKIKASNGSEYTPDSVFTKDGETLGVIGQPESPGLSVTEMQKSVEAVVRNISIPAFNKHIDELTASTASENIGANDKNGKPTTVQKALKAAVSNDGTIPYIRLNPDKQIEFSLNGQDYEATGSSGHIIVDSNGVVLPQRSRMQFTNGTVIDSGGVTVVTAMKGDRGDIGPQGPKGDPGDTGAQGPHGKVMVPSINVSGVMSWELQDTALPPSPVNVRGPQGPQGVQGRQGTQGVQGVPGPQGIEGPQGVPGEPGEPGRDGTSLYIEDTYPTLQALRDAFPTGNANMYYVVATEQCYIWSETILAWVSVGKLRGPQGVPGQQGIQGIQGVQGLQGPPGADGTAGKSAYQSAVEAGFAGTETAFNEALSKVPGHIASTSNPHNVTKSQVGLGQVDNTADKDKPVSTAQQEALNMKAPLDSPAFTGNVTVPDQPDSDNSTKAANTKFVQSAVTSAMPKKVSVTISETWSGTEPDFTQTVSIAGLKATSKIDLQPDAVAIQQLISDGVTALYIENNNGTCTAHAIGAKTTKPITVQATIEEVTA